jgi:HSP20 family protein
MLMRTDPFRELDRLSEALWGNGTRPSTMMPLTAYRENGTFVVHLDLPGFDPGSIDVTVEQNVLSVHAEREAPAGATQAMVDERRYGAFDRELILGDTLDLDQLSASYDAGVLTIKVPVSEQAQPRKIEVAAAPGAEELAT